MVKFLYPTEKHFRFLIQFIKDEKAPMGKYLPTINHAWYALVSDGMESLRSNVGYIEDNNFIDECSRVLYKFVKLHALADGNKRTGIIALYCFCVINSYTILDPEKLKQQAKRIARTKGNAREELIKRRVAEVLKDIIVPFR